MSMLPELSGRDLRSGVYEVNIISGSRKISVLVSHLDCSAKRGMERSQGFKHLNLRF